MANIDPFAFQGRVEPEDLQEPVVFKGGRFLLHLAYLGGIGGFLLASIVLLTVRLLTDPLAPLTMRLPVSIGIACGVTAGIFYWRRNGGRQVRVDREGITVTRRGTVVQQCRWKDMTLRSSRRIRPLQMLCDETGRAFPVDDLWSEHPGQAQAKLAISTRMRDLANERAPAKKNVLSWWLVPVCASVGSLGLLLVRTCTAQMSTTFADLSSSQMDRAVALLKVLGSGLLFVPLFASILMLQMLLIEAVSQRTRKKNRILQEFIDERKGRLATVDLQPGIWYGYVAPDQLRANEQRMAGAVTLLIFVALFVGFMIYSIEKTPSGKPLIATVCTLFAALGLTVGVSSFHRTLSLRRAMFAQIRRTAFGYQIRRIERRANGFDGQPLGADLIKTSRKAETATTQFGQVWWRLRTEAGAVLEIDPRYLVPQHHA